MAADIINPSLPPSIGAALGWNIVPIVTGISISVVGLIIWGGMTTPSSAVQQTVSALWLIAILMGLLIASVGVLGATIIYTLDQRS